MRELAETLPVLLLLLVLCGLDRALYSVFNTIRHHSFLQYSFRSEPAPGPWEVPRPTPAATPPDLVQCCHLLLCLTPPWPSQGQISALQSDGGGLSSLYIRDREGLAFSEGRKVPRCRGLLLLEPHPPTSSPYPAPPLNRNPFLTPPWPQAAINWR